MGHKLDQSIICPVCSSKNDGATSMDGTDLVPKPGDYSSCWYCKVVLIFTGTPLGLVNGVRTMTKDETLEFIEEHPNMAAMVFGGASDQEAFDEIKKFYSGRRGNN